MKQVQLTFTNEKEELVGVIVGINEETGEIITPDGVLPLSASLGCIMGLHAYVNGRCHYCGKKKP